MRNNTIKYLKENFGRLIKIRHLKHGIQENEKYLIGVIAKQNKFWENSDLYKNHIVVYWPYYFKSKETYQCMVIDCNNDEIYFEPVTKEDLKIWIEIYESNKNHRDTEENQLEYGIDIKNIKY